MSGRAARSSVTQDCWRGFVSVSTHRRTTSTSAVTSCREQPATWAAGLRVGADSVASRVAGGEGRGASYQQNPKKKTHTGPFCQEALPPPPEGGQGYVVFWKHHDV